MRNNLAGVESLLGNIDAAVDLLERSRSALEALGLEADVGYVLTSLAEIHLDGDRPRQAADLALRALALLEGRADHVLETGMAHLALGRALTRLGDLDESRAHLDRAAAIFDASASPSHRAEAWLAEGDLARSRGDERQAALLYRRAAVALQPGSVA